MSGRREGHLAANKCFLAGVLMILAAGTAVAAIMALRIATYLPRLIHH
jgi:hypothetical protein